MVRGTQGRSGGWSKGQELFRHRKQRDGEDREAGRRQDVMSGTCEGSLLFPTLSQESGKQGLR